MKMKIYMKGLIAIAAMLLMTLQVSAQVIPSLNGNPYVGGGVTTEIYTTDPGQTGYAWTVTSAGSIQSGQGTATLTVQWNNPGGNQTITVTYDGATSPGVLVAVYYPFPTNIDPTTIPQFVDPVPHFAAGLRVDAKAGGNLKIKDVLVQQVALSTGTVLANGTIGDVKTPNAGLGNYCAYAISKDGGVTYGPAMWPAQTIEAQAGNQLVVQYENDLFGVKFSDLNILADQMLMMNGFTINGNPQTDPYLGDIPMVVHLHGGEIPSNSDGGPLAWFTPGYAQQGPGFALEASTVCTYPNNQESPTLWYHPHDQGLTRINVYTGLAGYYFIRQPGEDNLHLPGWSGDGLVREVTPPGKTATFNGTNTYKPEIELAIQDRMFNIFGQLYWPAYPTNPDYNPYWTPEFFGDVMTVNGKSWPYLSVAPRKYMFRLLDGCNARFLNMWLSSNPDLGLMDGPPITVISTEGGFLDAPVTFNPALGQTLFLAPAERPMVIIDFTGYAPGTTFTLMNDALAPYPTGDPVIPGLTDRIMQFVVNGEIVTPDASVIPANPNPSTPMIKLTNFNGTNNVTPTVKRQIILNEITGAGGPLRVAINNSHFDNGTPAPGEALTFGGPTEMPTEGTTELWQIINTTADAHPIHPHLVQFQLVSRQAFNDTAYMNAYSAAWAAHVPPVPNFPSFATYPGGAGSPYPYSTVNTDGAIGGNPPVSGFLLGPVIPALPEEQGWKDAIKSLPGQVETYIVRFAPTTKPINAPDSNMVFPFDPSTGPGYVWHCHIIDHEDMDMMRPMLVQPSYVRFPNITANPLAVTVCEGWNTTFSVAAWSINPITYLWQYSSNGTDWYDLANSAAYHNVGTPTLTIDPAAFDMNQYQYRCKLSTVEGTVYSTAAILTVLYNPPPTLTGPNPVCENANHQVYMTDAGMFNYLWSIPSTASIQAGGTTVDNTVTLKFREDGGYPLSVNFTRANGCTGRIPTLINVTVLEAPEPEISGPSSVTVGTTATYTTSRYMLNYFWSVTGSGATIMSGQGTRTVTISFTATGTKTVNVCYDLPDGCTCAKPGSLSVRVNKPKDEPIADVAPVSEYLYEVYPVPNDGQFTAVITAPEEKTFSIQVYNTMGEKVYEKGNITVNGTVKTNIDIRPAPAGLYSVIFMNSERQAVRKILINR